MATEILSFVTLPSGDPITLSLDGVNLEAVPVPESSSLLPLGGLAAMTGILMLRRNRRVA